MENPLQSQGFSATIQRYTQKTRKGDFREGAKDQVSRREEALRKKKPKTED